MISKINSDNYFVFDLDDTLYQEIDYLRSAYKYISQELKKKINIDLFDEMCQRYGKKENVFEWVVKSCANLDPSITIPYLLQLYRFHIPDIKLNEKVKFFLDSLSIRNIPSGLITDGRSVTQRNKLKALGLANYFQDIIISEEFGSEKPDEKNYLYFVNKYPDKRFIFIGDNTSKDFIVPQKFGWFTVCIKNPGNNIHEQSFSSGCQPDMIVESICELVGENQLTDWF
jgi:putative hydrolase of the HAD superfamily